MEDYIKEANLHLEVFEKEVANARARLHAAIEARDNAAQKAVMHIHGLSKTTILISRGIEYKFASIYDKNPDVSQCKPWVKVYKKTASGWSKKTIWLSGNWEIKK